MTAAPEEPKARWMGMLDRTRCETDEGLHLRTVYREVGQIIENNGELPDSEFFRAHDGFSVTVVTADRALAERVRETGAEVVGPRWLLDRFVE